MDEFITDQDNKGLRFRMTEIPWDQDHFSREKRPLVFEMEEALLILEDEEKVGFDHKDIYSEKTILYKDAIKVKKLSIKKKCMKKIANIIKSEYSNIGSAIKLSTFCVLAYYKKILSENSDIIFPFFLVNVTIFMYF